MKLVIKRMDADGRLSLLPTFLQTAWDIEIADSDDRAEFERALERADALVSMSWRGDVPPTPNLRLLQLPGAGTDDIDFTLVGPHTSVCNCFEHEIGIAEYVLAAMLEWTIGLRKMDAQLRQGDWTGSYLCGPRHGEVFGKTLGIVGYGRIGRETARRATAFGMRVTACSRSPRAGDGCVARVAGMEGLQQVLEEADFLLVALPLSPQTQGLIGAAELGRMKREAVVINVARGPIIEERALYDALADRRIAGACIDVWYHYPEQGKTRAEPANVPFHELDNIIMTPHASGWTDGLLPRRNRAIAENLDRLARGEPLLNVVRPARRAVTEARS